MNNATGPTLIRVEPSNKQCKEDQRSFFLSLIFKENQPPLMAAYAAVVSLMNTMEQMQNHPCHSFSFDKAEVECLRLNVTFLLEFLESYSHGGSKELERQIAAAAYKAEDVIESHIVDQILAGSTLRAETCSCSLINLQKVIKNMDFVKKKIMKAKRGVKHPQRAFSTTSRSFTTGKINGMVGFSDELIHLMDVLTGQSSSRQVISVVGMGGMGKTTLAKNVFENSLIVHHFDIRIWATISQEYSRRKILLELIGQGKTTSEIDKKTEEELGEKLYKSLWGRRYFVVLDDIWSLEAWDSIKVYLPDNQNRSRVVVTTRQSGVASRLGSMRLAMNFLDDEKSWSLFCQTAFSEQCCPPELEEIGKMIVKKCRGLPLLIVLFGGHLGKSSMNKEYWESFVNDVTSNLDSEDEQCFDILSLSYNYLPAHLKPCFLYMGVFPEDYKISVSTLVKLWVAEGFIKPSESQSLEEVAEGCLKDLVDRNLIIVRKWGLNGRIKTCSIHDLLRELCLKVAFSEKFLYVVKLHDTQESISKERRLVAHRSITEKMIHFNATESEPLTRSLHCKGGQVSFDYRLLKVLKEVEGVASEVDGNLFEIKLQQVNLRYLDCNFARLLLEWELPGRPILPLCLPSSISLLWNLQTIIIKSHPGHILAPLEIWKMAQLRHVMVIGIHLPDPPQSDEENDFVSLQNLQTLVEVRKFKLSEGVCKRIPNIKKLHVGYCDQSSNYYPHNLCHFKKLESLRCFFPKEPNWRCFVLSFAFPNSLKKLHLRNCFLHWEDLSVIGSLPRLEVLKLDCKSVVGSEWNSVEGEFVRLKSLKIYACEDLINWNAESCHFPVLEKLVLERLNVLDEIPAGIGEIPTLRFIRLECCSVSAAVSAMRMLVEQESWGNEGLQLEVEFWNEEELGCFRGLVEIEGLLSNNLRLQKDGLGF